MSHEFLVEALATTIISTWDETNEQAKFNYFIDPELGCQLAKMAVDPDVNEKLVTLLWAKISDEPWVATTLSFIEADAPELLANTAHIAIEFSSLPVPCQKLILNTSTSEDKVTVLSTFI